MACLSLDQAFIIIRIDKNERIHEIIRYTTPEGTYLAASIDICREMLKNPKVTTAFEQLAVDFDPGLEAWYKDWPKDEIVKIFIDNIMKHFPVFCVDYSMTNLDTLFCYWRETDDHGIGFDAHKHSIVINGVVIDNTCLAGISAQGIEDPDSKEQKRFRVFLFCIATSFLHELGHMFVTFLGGRKSHTPPHIDAQVHGQSVSSSGTKGEAGAYMQYMTFGGTVSLPRETTENDKQPGIAYLTTETGTYQISQKTIDEFVKRHFTFPFTNLGPEQPAGMQTIGHGLPWIASKRDPTSEPETRQLSEGHLVNPFRLEKTIRELIEDNPNPKIFNENQQSVMRQVPFDPSLRIVGSA